MAGNEAPPFWYAPSGVQAKLLSPIGWGYGAVARYRLDRRDVPQVDAPVVCVGNLTVGGTGKTPTALALADAAEREGHRPGFVSRGYGGSHARTHIVDAEADTTRSVGDEPLLLSRRGPTAIGANRAQGAKALIDAGVDFIIMDDGFQSRTLAMDYALIVVDARRGLGNGHVIPAGPLRAPLRDQMRLADLILRVGEGEAAEDAVRAAARAGKPVAQARLVPIKPKGFRKRRVMAFCGIGDPDKFYASLESVGCTIVDRRSFGDHHQFTEAEAVALLERAEADDLALVTTQKDAVRLSYSEGALARLRDAINVFGVELVFEMASMSQTIIATAAERHAKRRMAE